MWVGGQCDLHAWSLTEPPAQIVYICILGGSNVLVQQHPALRAIFRIPSNARNPFSSPGGTHPSVHASPPFPAQIGGLGTQCVPASRLSPYCCFAQIRQCFLRGRGHQHCLQRRHWLRPVLQLCSGWRWQTLCLEYVSMACGLAVGGCVWQPRRISHPVSAHGAIGWPGVMVHGG